MVTWTPPVLEYRFILEELLKSAPPVRTSDGEVLPIELAEAVLSEAGKFCAEVLLPLNRSGDEEGCRLENGRVRTPAGFPEAYAEFRAAGWPSLSADPRYGGQGLPHLLATFVEEMMCAANHGFGMYPGLAHAAYEAILDHAEPDLRDRYLPKLVSGEWLGTMALTEPQCGTDLGLTRTRAVPADDGSYRITGTKMFISGGDQDLTDSILHLVLARLPDAPSGTRGLSMFLVPSHLDGENGLVRNSASCISLEHKMGVRASATCMMSFEDATGWLIGAPNRGLAAMFTMMNLARVTVAAQAVGLGEAALQSATLYARDRLQGRAAGEARDNNRAADPLLSHPDVRRMLLTIRAYVEGGRALAAWLGHEIDLAKHETDPVRRRQAAELAALLTPVAKAFVSDTGFEACVLAQQVFGGHGYINEVGVEQLVRDARVTQIYEGANGIQAIDLVGRKLQLDGGAPLRAFLDRTIGELEALVAESDLAVPALAAFRRLDALTETLLQRPERDQLAVASDYLRCFGLTVLGYLWARSGHAAARRLGGGDDPFYRRKLATAEFFMTRLLPQSAALDSAIRSQQTSMLELAVADF